MSAAQYELGEANLAITNAFINARLDMRKIESLWGVVLFSCEPFTEGYDTDVLNLQEQMAIQGIRDLDSGITMIAERAINMFRDRPFRISLTDAGRADAEPVMVQTFKPDPLQESKGTICGIDLRESTLTLKPLRGTREWLEGDRTTARVLSKDRSLYPLIQVEDILNADGHTARFPIAVARALLRT